MRATDAVGARHWTQRVGGFTELPALIRQLGAEPASVLASVGLAPDALDDCDARIPYASCGALLREAAERTGCAHFGLLAGRMWRLPDLGVVGELMRNSETVGEALRTLTVYQHLNSGSALAFLLERGGMVDVGYAIYQPGVSGTDQMYDAVLAMSCNFLRDLCGPAWVPTEVLLPHARPRVGTPYRHLLKFQPRFNAEFCAVRFPGYWMEQRIEGYDPARRRLVEQRAEQADDGQLVEEVCRALRLVMLHGRTSGDDVAAVLSMHRRTLNRRLKAEGTTFQEVLDQVRFEVARQLLGDSEIALDDVAATLGYAGISPFMRTFRRWAGTTPGRWRRAIAYGA